MAPVRARIASKSVVLPLAKGPTMAMHFGPVRLPPARLPIMPDLLLIEIEAAAGLSGRRDAAGSPRRHVIVTRVGGEGKGESTNQPAKRRHAHATGQASPEVSARRTGQGIN